MVQDEGFTRPHDGAIRKTPPRLHVTVGKLVE